MNCIFDRKLLHNRNISAGFFASIKNSDNLVLHLTASNTFQVFVDGEFIFYGGIRRGHGFGTIHKVEVPNSQKEKRSIAVVVASYNINTFYTVLEEPYFGVEIYSNDKIVANSNNFAMSLLDDRVQKVERYSVQRPFCEVYSSYDKRENYYLTGQGYKSLCADAAKGAKLLYSDIPLCQFTKSKFTEIERGRVEFDNYDNKYTHRYIEEAGSDFMKGYKKSELECHLSKEVCEFKNYKAEVDNTKANTFTLYGSDVNYTGFVSLNVAVKEDCELYIYFDEIIYDEIENNEQKKSAYIYDGSALPLVFYRSATTNAVKWSLKKGNYKLMTFEPYTMKYLNVTIKGGKAKVSDLKIIKYQQDYIPFSFTTDDEKVNNIIKAGIETYRQNAVDVLTDCPSRERAGWLCDSYFSAQAEWLLTGDNKVEKNFLTTIINQASYQDLPQGMLPMCYPSDSLNGRYIPNWAMWFVIEILDYQRRSNDNLLVDIAKEKVYGVLNFFKKYLNKYDLLEKLDSWVFVEWSKSNDFVQDVNIPSNMLYYRALMCGYNLYGDEEFLLLAKRIKSAIIKYGYNGEFFIDNLMIENGFMVKTENITETCQYYALSCGIVDEEKFSLYREKIVENFGCFRDINTVYPNIYPSNAFIGAYLRFEYLVKHSYYEKFLAESITYFSTMAERTGTLWEHDRASASCSHGFASYVINLLVRSVTGIDTLGNKDKKSANTGGQIKNYKLEYILNGKQNTVVCKDGKVTHKEKAVK